MRVINFLISLFVLTVIYHLAMAYLNIEFNYKKSIFPSIVLSSTAFILKDFFHTAPVIHTIIIVLACTILLFFNSKISVLLSLIGSLLAFITLMVGSLLLVCPFLIKMGIQITKETSNNQWVVLNLAEALVPLLVLLYLRIKKISLVRNFR